MASVEVKIHVPKTIAGWLIGSVSLLVVLVVAVLLLTPRGAFLQIVPWGRTDVAWLPRLNAGLNATSALLLTAAYLFIRRRQVRYHRLCMLFAFGLSALFLVSYVIYHTVVGPTRFTGPDWLWPIYLAILISHIVFAVFVLPLALTTLYRAWRRRFAQHRHIARWTLPIWLYVSTSGVLVYLILYHWN
jgi:putative membrane protein